MRFLSLLAFSLLLFAADARADDALGVEDGVARTHVHITSGRNVQLYRRPEGTESWVRACTAPCDLDLPTADDYRITGDAMPSSGELKLDPERRSVDIHVKAPDKSGMIFGALIAGSSFFCFEAGLPAALGAPGSNISKGEGQTLLAVGGVAAFVGLYVFVRSFTTDTEIH